MNNNNLIDLCAHSLYIYGLISIKQKQTKEFLCFKTNEEEKLIEDFLQNNKEIFEENLVKKIKERLVEKIKERFKTLYKDSLMILDKLINQNNTVYFSNIGMGEIEELFLDYFKVLEDEVDIGYLFETILKQHSNEFSFFDKMRMITELLVIVQEYDYEDKLLSSYFEPNDILDYFKELPSLNLLNYKLATLFLNNKNDLFKYYMEEKNKQFDYSSLLKKIVLSTNLNAFDFQRDIFILNNEELKKTISDKKIIKDISKNTHIRVKKSNRITSIIKELEKNKQFSSVAKTYLKNKEKDDENHFLYIYKSKEIDILNKFKEKKDFYSSLEKLLTNNQSYSFLDIYNQFLNQTKEIQEFLFNNSNFIKTANKEGELDFFLNFRKSLNKILVNKISINKVNKKNIKIDFKY